MKAIIQLKLRIKRGGLALLLSAVFLLTGCMREIPRGNAAQDSTTDTTQPQTSETQPVYQLELPEIQTQEASLFAEAETAKLYGSLHAASDRAGYSGDGYVSGFDNAPTNQIITEFSVPSTQHYDVTICVASDSAVKNSLTVDGTDVGEFSLEGTGTFIRVTFHGIFMKKGKVSISILEEDGDIDLDYVELTNNTSLYQISYEAASGVPVNSSASAATKELMSRLKAHYGTEILTGQYVSSPENLELELIHDVTGQYPAIRFGDLRSYTDAGEEGSKEIEQAIAWAEQGGVVGYMWYWTAPLGTSSVYAAETDFSLQAAMTDEAISCLSQTDLNAMCDLGIISEECLALIKSIDAVGDQLKRLKQEGIPVLWRPLQEAGGGWYWWGSDGAEAYQWLWKLLYSRLNDYYGLDNLIWIWNGQSEAYYVGDAYFDIASIDVYLSADSTYGSRNGQFQWLYALTKGEKMLALSECSATPDIEAIFRDNAIWSFYGLWYGQYLMESDGTLNEAYTTEIALQKIYNSEGAINLQEWIARSEAS